MLGGVPIHDEREEIRADACVVQERVSLGGRTIGAYRFVRRFGINKKLKKCIFNDICFILKR